MSSEKYKFSEVAEKLGQRPLFLAAFCESHRKKREIELIDDKDHKVCYISASDYKYLEQNKKSIEKFVSDNHSLVDIVNEHFKGVRKDVRLNILGYMHSKGYRKEVRPTTTSNYYLLEPLQASVFISTKGYNHIVTNKNIIVEDNFVGQYVATIGRKIGAHRDILIGYCNRENWGDHLFWGWSSNYYPVWTVTIELEAYLLKNAGRIKKEIDRDLLMNATIAVKDVAKEYGISPAKLLEIFKARGCGNRVIMLEGVPRVYKHYSEQMKPFILAFLKDAPTKETKELVVQAQKIVQPEVLNAVSVPDVDIIGYADVKEYIVEQLEPILSPEDCALWGLERPGGILLYGPPGCGKTHWANWVASHLQLKFYEMPRSNFGSPFVDGAMLGLKNKIEEVKKESPAVLFFDEFDTVAQERSGNNMGSSNENAKVVNTLLQELPKLIEAGIIVLAATNFVNHLDAAIVRPGRFDMKLPIFPPLPEERAELVLYGLHLKIHKDAPLFEILAHNNANNEKFWMPYAKQMLLFSISYVLDAAKLIKKRIRKAYKKTNKTTDVIINEELINPIIEEVKSNFTAKEVEVMAKFIEEFKVNKVKSLQHRMEVMREELDAHDEEAEVKRKPVGFKFGKNK